MQTEKEIEARRRKVENLKLRGYKQYEIAEKLEVSEQTISADVKVLNERYKKLVIDNPQYLEQRVEKIIEFLDKYNVVLKQLYDLKEGNSIVNDAIHNIVNRFLPEFERPIEPTDKENKEAQKAYNNQSAAYKYRLRERYYFGRELNRLAKSNTSDMVTILREVRNTLGEQAKILQLITGNKTYNIQQNNYVHIAKVESIFKKLQYIIEKFIPKDKRKEVYEILKTISVKDK